MFEADEFEKMNFKQLRSAVQELYDSYVKLKRLVEDSLDNIDESNLATTFRKKLGDNESMLSITAEKIESRVSYEDLENNLSQYSTIKQTANQIQMTVVQNREYTDSAKEELSSTFTMTADRISTNVVKLNEKVDGNYAKFYSSITQTAEAIETIVGKEITATFERTTMPTADNTSEDEQDNKLCKYNDTLYYFNKITQTWREYNGDVESAFKQTADGFELNGCVSVSGDLITKGTISAERIDTDNLSCTKLYGTGSNYNYFKVVSNWGDVGLFKETASENANAKDEDCIWGIYQADMSNGAIYMYSRGNALFGYNNAQKKLYPMGIWDFSSCDEVRGLQTASGEDIIVK